MLKTEKFYVKNDALKVKDFSMLDYVKTLVRHTELSRVKNKKSFKDGKKILEDEYLNIDVLTCEESIINNSLKSDAGQFIKDREEIKALQKECDACISLDKVTALRPTDRAHIALMAHMIYKNVTLETVGINIFNEEEGGVDISKPISNYYNKSNSLKELKNSLRPVFNRLFGEEGDYFYAIKTKRTDLEDKDLKNFLAIFGGDAKRQTVKKGKEVIYKDCQWIDKSADKKTQITAFTRLCAVILDNASKHSVVKPEEEKEEEKTA